MLTEEQIKEIKEHLEKAQNPVFFYDNDPDGLCSFLLLQRYIERGRGVAIRSFPELDASYFRKVEELNADYIFILDKPLVSSGFWKEVEKVNIPVVWIDHHDTGIFLTQDSKIPVSETLKTQRVSDIGESLKSSNVPIWVNYYNPIFNADKKSEPVTYLCYQITKRKEDLWLAVAGCIFDHFVPDFYSEFKKIFSDLSIEFLEPFDIFYKSQIGKIARIFSFALKDRVTNVVNMQRFLLNDKTPYDILEENSKNYTMHLRFEQINKKYLRLIEKAVGIEKNSGKILFFQYGGDLSISSDLANELSYRFPKKIIVVVYIAGVKANISIRGKNVRGFILKAIEGLEGATGGGHEDAVGAQVKIEDLEKFRNLLEEKVE